MRSKAYLKMRERLVSAARREKKPIIGHFELTARCNLDCKMCYVHTQDNAVAQKKELPFVKKHRKLFFTGVNLIIISVGLLSYKNLTSLLPVIGVLLHTSAFWFSDEKLIRWVSILGCPFWLSYDLISGAYGSAIGNVIAMVSILMAIVRYDILKQESLEQKSS